MLKLRVGPSSEFPRAVYWVLFVVLWLLLIATVVVSLGRLAQLEPWKHALYDGLLAAYVWAERHVHVEAPQTGQRSDEWLRYLLSLSWWALTIGCILVYALWPHRHLAVTITGAVMYTCGASLRVLSVRTLGRFYSGHIETWQGQAVVDTGPYRRIRHPGYLGSMVQALAMPLILGAYPALPLAIFVIGLFVRRLQLEEQYLTAAVPGYAAYVRRTSRLLAGVW
jgi:protein-S-isoprenylcysteine O-methyltransferase Ste14